MSHGIQISEPNSDLQQSPQAELAVAAKERNAPVFDGKQPLWSSMPAVLPIEAFHMVATHIAIALPSTSTTDALKLLEKDNRLAPLMRLVLEYRTPFWEVLIRSPDMFRAQ